MKNYTLTIILNKDKTHVLMCFHRKQKLYNFVGGKVKEGEGLMLASYRELEEETGITENDITLHMVRQETVYPNELLYDDSWKMYVTYGVVDKFVELVTEKNTLLWVPIDSNIIDKESMGYGNCRVFLNEALLLDSRSN